MRILRPVAGAVLPDLLRATAALGQFDDMHRYLEQAIDVGNFNRVFQAALELRVHGHPETADSVLVRLVDILDRREANPEVKAQALTSLGHLEEARAIWEDLVDRRGTMSDRGRLATVLALQGDKLAAQRISDELARLEDDYLLGSHTVWRAMIAASLQEKELAVDLLREAFDQGATIPASGIILSWHFEPAFESLWDYEPFIEFMRPKG